MTPNTLPNLSAPAAAPAHARGGANAANAGAGDANQFSQALSREMVQRQAPPPAAPQPRPAAPAQQAKPAQPQPQAKAPEPTGKPTPQPASADKAAGPSTAQAGAKDGAGERSADAAAAAEAAAATPVTDMLALVASFNQAPAAPVVAAAIPTAPGGGVGDALSGGARNLTPAAAWSAPAAAVPAAAVAAAVAEAVAPAQFALPPGMEAAIAEATPIPAELQAKLAATSGTMPVMAKAEAAVVPALDGATTAAAPEIKLDGAVLAQPAGEAPTRAAIADTVNTPQIKVQADVGQSPQLRTRDVAAETAPVSEIQASTAPASAPVQQATLAAAQSVNGAQTDKIPARVGTPAWDNQVSQKIVWMVAGKEQSASLTLNPPDMGPMQVVLTVNNDQASVTFTAAQPEVRQALENAMPKLRDMMSESGIELGNATVNSGQPEQRQAQGEQGRPGMRGERDGGGQGRGETNGSAAEAAARNAARPRAVGGAAGMVDTFA